MLLREDSLVVFMFGEKDFVWVSSKNVMPVKIGINANLQLDLVPPPLFFFAFSRMGKSNCEHVYLCHSHHSPLAEDAGLESKPWWKARRIIG